MYSFSELKSLAYNAKIRSSLKFLLIRYICLVKLDYNILDEETNDILALFFVLITKAQVTYYSNSGIKRCSTKSDKCKLRFWTLSSPIVTSFYERTILRRDDT